MVHAPKHQGWTNCVVGVLFVARLCVFVMLLGCQTRQLTVTPVVSHLEVSSQVGTWGCATHE